MKKTKIACVGDSITHGFLLFPRKKHAYPTVLQKLLGDTFLVKNFGVNGVTVTQTGNRPYMKQQAYADSLSFQPDIVIIMLSTNDTRVMNRDTARFKPDYLTLLASYKQLGAKIIILSSPQLYAVRRRETPYYSMDIGLLETYRTITKEIIAEQNIEYLDVHAISLQYQECFMMDGVHPNKTFAVVIAQAVSNKIKELEFEE